MRTSKFKPTHQSQRELGFLKKLSASREMRQGSAFPPMEPDASLHTDAAYFECRSKPNVKDLSAGAPGMWCDHRALTWRHREYPIAIRELKIGPVSSGWPFGPRAPAKRNTASVSTIRQHGRGPNLQCTGFVQRRDDEILKTAQFCTQQNVNRDSSRVVTDRTKAVRRWTVTKIPPWRPLNSEISAAFNRG